MSRHALVVGGTGMLRGVGLWLAKRGWDVSVVARRHATLAALAREAGGRVWPASADYRDAGAVAAARRTALTARGPVEIAASWIHDDAPRAAAIVGSLIADDRRPARYFDVVGSEAADPAAWMGAGEALRTIPGIRYRRIVLGFVLEGR